MEDQNKIVTGGQVRMARAYLRWSASNLAEKSSVALSTIKRIESVDGISNTQVNNLLAVKEAFLSTGRIRFDGDNCVCVEEKSSG